MSEAMIGPTRAEIELQAQLSTTREMLAQAEELRKAHVATINESGAFLERIVTENRTTREIARELLCALKVQHKNCVYCKHYPDRACIAADILARAAGLLDDRRSAPK